MNAFHYLLFYKPYEVLCQFSPEGEKRTLAGYLKDFPKDVYPAGRLDYDSEGLLLLTNDKALTHKLLTPAFGHGRTYYVQVEGSPTPPDLDRLARGVDIRIDGKAHRTLPAKVLLLEPEPLLPPRNPPIRFRQSIPTTWLSITLREGKNRQVRRMTAAVGLPTLRLIRYSIGGVEIGSLMPGTWRAASREEVAKLLLPMA